MIDAKSGYKDWASIYDSNINKTRDLEKEITQGYLNTNFYPTILEIGCGTGKNSIWLKEICKSLICVDFSDEMIALAQIKINDPTVDFIVADIKTSWTWLDIPVDLIVCSLVLEHIEDPTTIFLEATKNLRPNGLFYICELHPYKHLAGSQAKFKKGKEQIEVESYLHHISKINSIALSQNLVLESFNEWFDDTDVKLPRLVSYVFRNPS